jgi:hypothetical protein
MHATLALGTKNPGFRNSFRQHADEAVNKHVRSGESS